MAPTKLSPRHVATAVLAAVVIGVIGVGSWAAWGRHLPVEQAIGEAPVGEAGRSPADPLAIAELAGAKENYARIRSMRGVAYLGMLTRDEVAAFEEYGAGRVRLAVSKFDTGRATVLLVRMPDEIAARYATDRLSALQHGYGFRPIDDAPRGVEAGVVGGDNPAEPGGRAHYRHGDIVVRVEFRGARPGPARAKFLEVMRLQAHVVTPDA